MSNLETLKQKATELEAKLKQQVEETTAKLKEMKEEIDRLENGWEMKCPYKDGDVYYIITTSGLVNYYHWNNDSFENMDFKQGNIFPTKQAAELEAKRRNLLTRFRAFRDECNNGWKPDWKNHRDRKYFISFVEGGKLVIFNTGTINQLCLFGYFKNEQDAERAIDLFGKEIKELFVECE